MTFQSLVVRMETSPEARLAASSLPSGLNAAWRPGEFPSFHWPASDADTLGPLVVCCCWLLHEARATLAKTIIVKRTSDLPPIGRAYQAVLSMQYTRREGQLPSPASSISCTGSRHL